MGERADEGGAGAQHAVHLAQHAVEVVEPSELVDREGGIDGVGPYERQLGEVAVVELELDLVGVGQVAGGLEAVEVRVDHDDVSALGGEGDGGVASTGPEDQEATALDGPEHAEGRLVGDVGPVHHDVDRQLGSGGERGRGDGFGCAEEGRLVHRLSLPRLACGPVDQRTVPSGPAAPRVPGVATLVARELWSWIDAGRDHRRPR